MIRQTFSRGPQGYAKLMPADAALLTKWTNKHGYDGAAKCLGVSPTIVHKLSHDGIATVVSVKRLSDALSAAEQRLLHKSANAK